MGNCCGATVSGICTDTLLCLAWMALETVRWNCCSFHRHIPSPVSAFLQKSLSLGSSPIWHSQPQPQEPVANPGPGATSVTSTPMEVDSVRTDYHRTTGHPTLVIDLTMATSVPETPEPPLPSAPPRPHPPRLPPPHADPAVAIETPTAMEP